TERIEVGHGSIAEQECPRLVVVILGLSYNLARCANGSAETVSPSESADVHHVGAVVQKRVWISAAIGGVTGDQPGIVNRQGTAAATQTFATEQRQYLHCPISVDESALSVVRGLSRTND